MSPTILQLSRGARQKKHKRLRAGAFDLAPHRKGVVYKIATMSPRKPNSAKRTYAKVRLTYNGRKLFAKIPGIGEHFLQAHSLFSSVAMVLKTVLVLISFSSWFV